MHSLKARRGDWKTEFHAVCKHDFRENECYLVGCGKARSMSSATVSAQGVGLGTWRKEATTETVAMGPREPVLPWQALGPMPGSCLTSPTSSVGKVCGQSRKDQIWDNVNLTVNRSCD